MPWLIIVTQKVSSLEVKFRLQDLERAPYRKIRCAGVARTPAIGSSRMGMHGVLTYFLSVGGCGEEKLDIMLLPLLDGVGMNEKFDSPNTWLLQPICPARHVLVAGVRREREDW